MNAPFPMASIMANGHAPDHCLPYQLPEVLDWFSGLKVLSLDCFDTLLWRDCHAPTDLFATLPAINPFQRVHGEGRARQLASARGITDVSIDEIYRRIMPRARDSERARAIADEIAAEARACYGFVPTIELMRAAKQRGLSVIVVSDTYLNPQQLRDLIARAAGADVAGLIDRVFCSSTYGKPKAGGLYGDVLPKLKARADQILHIGDNHDADVGGVAPFGVRTLHLRQFCERTQAQLRQESAVAAMIWGHRGKRLLTPQPHRPALAMETPRMASAARHFGFATLGPVLFGFDQWLRAEAQALEQANGGRVHWLFLMRDGHLPMLVHRASADPAETHAIEISRLTATFATFANDAAILAHVEESRGIEPAIIARQLRLDDATIAALCDGRSPGEAWRALHAFLRQPANRRPIVQAAQAMTQRMIEHVRRTVDPAPGDTLMLVDLGYNGSVQSLVDPILARELKVHVAGRYLILREVMISGCDKRGWLGEDNHDAVMLNALTANVALIEQLATAAQGSVIDYAADGTPVRGANDIGQAQGAVRSEAQAGVLDFAGAALASIRRAETPDLVAQWRDAGAAILMRLMYLPLREELEVVRSFEHDVNLGTTETLALFDAGVARHGLLHQGLFYQKGVRRMYLPAELAGEGLATRLTHLATARFAMPFTAIDFAESPGTVAVTLSRGADQVSVDLPVRPTHDGFVTLCIPVGASRFVATVPFGAIARHVEVISIVAMPAKEYLNGQDDSAAREWPVEPRLEGIEPLGPHLWHCPGPDARAVLAPPLAPNDVNLVIVVVYRPITA